MSRTYDELKNGMADQQRVRIEYRAKGQGRNYRLLGACAGLSAGIIAALIGSLLTAITWFTGAGSSYIHTLGTILLFMTIPLLVCGAHCLDLAESVSEEKSRKDGNGCAV